MGEKKYTIQEIRNLIQEFSDEMNPYKFLDSAKGIQDVQKLLARIQEGEKMLKIGDKVKTDYYPKDKDLIRVVINIKPYIGASESGYEVTTKDNYGRILSCDMNWYNK